MKINRDSWHYQCAEFFTKCDVSDSLCWYFWQVIGGIFAIIFSASILVGIGFLCITPLLMWFFEPLEEIGLLVSFGLALGLFWHLSSKWLSETDDASFIRVFAAKISAKKRRICPYLEFH